MSAAARDNYFWIIKNKGSEMAMTGGDKVSIIGMKHGEKGKKVVIIGTPHGENVPGKCSPDGNYYEYRFGRELAMALKLVLEQDGYTVVVDWTADVVPEMVQGKATKELEMRCEIVNAVCKAFGAENCVYVSVHSNASGSDGRWHDARGWSVYTSVGQTRSDRLASHIWDAAKELLSGKTLVRSDMGDGDPDYESDLYVLRKTACAAVLTENLFHDNREDVDMLLSVEGFERLVEVHRRGIEAYFESEVR